MFRKAYRLPFSLLGIPIYIDVTFLFILPVLAWMIASQVGVWARVVGVEDHPALHRPWVPLLLGLVAAVGLFASVLVHELGHSVVARWYGVPVRRITLWLLGGMAQFDEMPRQRGGEAVVAVAGPLVSVAVGILFWAVGHALPPSAVPAWFVVSYLWRTNLVLAIFNMLPALPLDGGRVLRSLLALRMPHLRATQIAAGVSKFLAILLGLAGLFTGNLMLMAVAFFVYVAGNAEVRDSMVAEMLAGVRVGELMSPRVGTVPPDMGLVELAREMVRQHQQGFVVVDPSTNRVVGMVSLEDLQYEPPGNGHAQGGHAQGGQGFAGQGVGGRVLPPDPRAADVMRQPVCTIRQEAPAIDALQRMGRTRCSRLAVVDAAGNMVGVITKNDLMRAIEMRTMGLHWGAPADDGNGAPSWTQPPPVPGADVDRHAAPVR
jgi:Zn-dependent protease/predicted transcriptional regulator